MLVPPLFLIFIDDNKIRFCMYSVCFVITHARKRLGHLKKLSTFKYLTNSLLGGIIR